MMTSADVVVVAAAAVVVDCCDQPMELNGQNPE